MKNVAIIITDMQIPIIFSNESVFINVMSLPENLLVSNVANLMISSIGKMNMNSNNKPIPCFIIILVSI